MKILIVLTYYRPHWTGLTQYAARLAEGLVKKGHQLEILASQQNKNLALSETIEGVKVTRVPFCCRFLRSVIMPGFPKAFWQAVKRNEKIIIFLPLQEIIITAIICKFLKKDFFLVHNGDLVLPEKGGIINRFVEKIYFLSTGFAIRLSNKIIIHSKDYAENSKHLSKFKNKWQVLLPPFLIPKVSPKNVSDFVKKYHLPEKKLIGFSGRFVEEKGIDYLMEAIPLVVQKEPKACFVFAGEHKVSYENFWERIKPLVEKNKKYIYLLGLLNQGEIFTFYKAIDLLVVPSRTDCFHFSQVECLLSGTPSVCTDIPGARWAVKESKMGLLVKARNPASLADGLVKGLKEKERLWGNWQKVKEIFDYEKAITAYEKLLQGN